MLRQAQHDTNKKTDDYHRFFSIFEKRGITFLTFFQ